MTPRPVHAFSGCQGEFVTVPCSARGHNGEMQHSACSRRADLMRIWYAH